MEILKTYLIGYDNKPEEPLKDFVILAETHSKAVAMFIRDSYRDAYKRSGLNLEAKIVYRTELKSARYATD